MQYEQFLDLAIDQVLAEAKQRWHNPKYYEKISEALLKCRREDPIKLMNHMLQANEAYYNSLTDGQDGNLCLIIHREVEWLCNIVSAFLATQGEIPVITPNDAGTQKMHKILKKELSKK